VASAVPEPAAACPVCRGFGLLETPDGRKLVPCRCREGAVRDGRRRGARIPERYRNCSLTNFNELSESQRAAKALARRFVRDYPAVDRGLLIVGPVGVGKTHLAVAILAELVDTMGAKGVFCDFTELLGLLQASFSGGGEESTEQILDVYREAELLVLDELGARRPTDWARDVLYGLLNTRYNRSRITILTTNFGDQPEKPGGETLELRVGTPVRSRLAEMCALVPLVGPDFRREVKQGRPFA
jgi:DNA replication protein DnaC